MMINIENEARRQEEMIYNYGNVLEISQIASHQHKNNLWLCVEIWSCLQIY